MQNVKSRDYVFYELTNSICHECLKKLEAKIIFQNNNVYLLKTCPEHGTQKVLLSNDIPYYKKCKDFLNEAQLPHKFGSEIRKGCPYDCGLCEDHEQHSCLTLIEITNKCNLNCPICFAKSSDSEKEIFRSLEEIEFMLDKVVEAEGQPDIIQLSGGEPTIHPQFFEILDLAKKKPIRHLMINTNGIRIAQEKDFVERLAKYKPSFEIYLQFDSLRPDALKELRGLDLTDIRKKAIENLNEVNLSTTLVVTVKKGCNDDELGEIINFALKQRAVRGVTFQPVQIAGRLEGFDSETNRITLSEIRKDILSQSSIFTEDDIIHGPCHPDALAMAYALKINNQVLPLTGIINPQLMIHNGYNTIVYEQEQDLKKKIIELFSVRTCLII